jgi:hypothetical protein
MIRTVWPTIACLAVLAALLVGKALKTPIALAAVTPIEATTIGAGSAQDPLTKSDRLEFARVRPEFPAQTASQPAEPLTAPVPTIVLPVEAKIVNRDGHDPNATASLAGKSRHLAQTATGKKAKSAHRKGRRIADRSKPAGPGKPCHRPGAVSVCPKSS